MSEFRCSDIKHVFHLQNFNWGIIIAQLQLIDDVSALTLASASSKEGSIEKSGTKSEQSKAVGTLIAEKAKSKNIENVVFDRSGYLYHGRVKALAEGAREGGLKF